MWIIFLSAAMFAILRFAWGAVQLLRSLPCSNDDWIFY